MSYFLYRYDCTDSDITMEEVKELEKKSKIKVLLLPDNANDSELAHILNHICSQLFSNKKISLDDVKTKYKL